MISSTCCLGDGYLYNNRTVTETGSQVELSVTWTKKKKNLSNLWSETEGDFQRLKSMFLIWVINLWASNRLLLENISH